MALDTVPYQTRGVDREFHCFPTWFSHWMCEAILNGDTYPPVAFIAPVDVVLDVGANCGAATVYLASVYPDAVVHAFEPGADQLELLVRNTRDAPNVQVHGFGLHAMDRRVPLYRGAFDTATASITPGSGTSQESEEVELRSAGAWLREQSIDRIDVLKLDTEGCEIPILEDLGADIVGQVKVLYVEYHSDEDRRRLDALLGHSHVLVLGRSRYLTGELMYVQRGAFDPEGPEITGWAARLFADELALSASRKHPPGGAPTGTDGHRGLPSP
jgi:FkbM family methyltransferase